MLCMSGLRTLCLAQVLNIFSCFFFLKFCPFLFYIQVHDPSCAYFSMRCTVAGCPAAPAPVGEKAMVPLGSGLCTFIAGQLGTSEWVCFWAFCSAPFSVLCPSADATLS